MRWSDANISDRDIGKVLGVSHQSVAKITTKAAGVDLDASQLGKLSDLELMAKLYPKSAGRPLRADKVEPDFASLVEELSKYPKLTRYLLWCEYREEVGAQAAYSYSSFCDKLKRFDLGQELTMVLHHGLGEVAMADYAGMTVPIFDQRGGESHPASIFVMSLGNSGYAFVQAHDSQDMANYLKGHADGFAFFEGTPDKVITDNLRAAVVANTKDQTKLTRSYLEMCEHYGVIPAPARPFHPRDKAKVETTVYLVETQILAPLRKRRFFSVAELNEEISPLLAAMNARPFAKMGGSRQERYQNQEKAALNRLPQAPYEYASWRSAKVGSHYHFCVMGVYYSVPFHLRGGEVEIKVTKDMVVAYANNAHVASHLRSYGKGSFVTDQAHAPESHRRYLEDEEQDILSRAKGVGRSTEEVIRAVMVSHPFPQTAYKSARAVLRLTRTYPPAEVESAAAMAIAISSPTSLDLSSHTR